MSIGHLARRFGNGLYTFAFPIYRPLYRAFKSYADRVERELLARHLSTGFIVVDAGANIGVYSQFLSQCVGPTGRVHSFEPDPNNFKHLQHLLARFPNVVANELAASDTTGQCTLYVSDKLNVDHRTYSTEGETRRTILIKSITLDDYFKPGERVDLIKLDIQGYELHALRGARRVLADNPQVKLLLEFWPYGLIEAGASAQGLLSFLQQRGFSTYLPVTHGLAKCDRPIADSTRPLDYFNLFAERKRGHQGLIHSEYPA